MLSAKNTEVQVVCLQEGVLDGQCPGTGARESWSACSLADQKRLAMIQTCYRFFMQLALPSFKQPGGLHSRFYVSPNMKNIQALIRCALISSIRSIGRAALSMISGGSRISYCSL